MRTIRFSADEVERLEGTTLAHAAGLVGPCEGHGVCGGCEVRPVHGDFTVEPDADGMIRACQTRFVAGRALCVEA